MSSISILSRLASASIELDPFPHLHVQDALDAALYAELADSYPSLERIARGRPLGNNRAYFLSAHELRDDRTMPAIWRDFFNQHSSRAFLQEALAFWREPIERAYPRIEQLFGKPLDDLTSTVRLRGRDDTQSNRAADVALDVQFGINTPVTSDCSVRLPHLDNIHKLFAALVYFRLPEDDSRGGDLELYRLTSPHYHHDEKMNIPLSLVEPVKTIPYRANSLIMWLNTPRSVHGVSARGVTRHARRYVNVIGECYTLTAGGFFPLQQRAPDFGTRLRRLVGARAL